MIRELGWKMSFEKLSFIGSGIQATALFPITGCDGSGGWEQRRTVAVVWTALIIAAESNERTNK